MKYGAAHFTSPLVAENTGSPRLPLNAIPCRLPLPSTRPWNGARVPACGHIIEPPAGCGFETSTGFAAATAGGRAPPGRYSRSPGLIGEEDFSPLRVSSSASGTPACRAIP
jgi:hypothetical protein